MAMAARTGTKDNFSGGLASSAMRDVRSKAFSAVVRMRAAASLTVAMGDTIEAPWPAKRLRVATANDPADEAAHCDHASASVVLQQEEESGGPGRNLGAPEGIAM